MKDFVKSLVYFLGVSSYFSFTLIGFGFFSFMTFIAATRIFVEGFNIAYILFGLLAIFMSYSFVSRLMYVFEDVCFGLNFTSNLSKLKNSVSGKLRLSPNAKIVFVSFLIGFLIGVIVF